MIPFIMVILFSVASVISYFVTDEVRWMLSFALMANVWLATAYVRSRL